MAISALTSLTLAQYRALTITPFSQSPIVSTGGTSPDNRVNIQLGGWVGTDVMAFIINEDPNIDSDLRIENPLNNIVQIDVTGDSDPDAESTYWTINMGTGAKSSDWQVTFDVADGSRDTGKWVFTKGKAAE